MEKLGNKELVVLINNNESNLLIEDCIIELDESINLDLSQKGYRFKKCILKGSRIDFFDFSYSIHKPKSLQSVEFIDCEIENDIFIKDCNIYSVDIKSSTIRSRNFHITQCSLEQLSVVGESEFYNKIDSFTLAYLTINKFVDFRLNDFSDVLTIIHSKMFCNCIINKNEANLLFFENTNFGAKLELCNNDIKSFAHIAKCNFQKLDISKSNFGIELLLQENEFNDTCIFEKLSNDLKTTIEIKQCNFNKYVYFDKSKIYRLIIDSVFFQQIVSFQDMSCNSLKFNRIHFDKIAFFNDIEIKNINNCDLRTIRTIKNQLLKVENKIDYLKFRAYEMEIHRKNLKSEKSSIATHNRILLKLNKITSSYNESWVRGLFMTLVYGFTLYIPLYFSKFNEPISSILFNTFWTGYFKFLIPNFNSPFGNDLNSWYEYMFFIIGKIMIGFGIYETIQSFRKYGKS